MLADRDSSMKLCFTLIYCIIPFDRELFSGTEAGQCVWYTGRLKVHEVNREAVTGCELSVENGTALKPRVELDCTHRELASLTDLQTDIMNQ